MRRLAASPKAVRDFDDSFLVSRLVELAKAVRDFDDSLLVSRLVELANSQDPHAALGALPYLEVYSALNLA